MNPVRTELLPAVVCPACERPGGVRRQFRNSIPLDPWCANCHAPLSPEDILVNDRPPPEHSAPPPPQYTVEKCNSCQAPIIWTTTSVGSKDAPVDAEPTPGGSIWLSPSGPGYKPLSVVLPAARRANHAKLYVSHFATCPDADAWRLRKGPRTARAKDRNP